MGYAKHHLFSGMRIVLIHKVSNINRQYICLNDELLTLRIASKGWLELKPEQLLQFQSNSDLNSFTKEVLLSKVNAFKNQ